MNADLLDLVRTDDIPDEVSVSVDANALIARFNPSGLHAGHYLAVGRSDGTVCIYDFESKNVILTLHGHVRGVTSVCWSRKCRFLMTASRDWTVIIWDLKTGERRNTVRFDAPVTSAALHPRNSKMLAVTLQSQAETIFVDLRPGGGRWEMLMARNRKKEEDQHDDELPKRDEITPKKSQRREHATVVRFSPRGDLVVVGSSLGHIYIFDTRSTLCVHDEVISANSSIHFMDFDRRGTALVINSNDRIIRVFGIDESTGNLILHHKFQDHIDQTPWSSCCFSKDGEYVIAGAGGSSRGNRAAHAVHVWDRASGQLVKILDGPKDNMEDLEVKWHPKRPIVATISDSGLIYIWVKRTAERWAAFAPGFEELEENAEYIENEDEFDVLDVQELTRRKLDEQNQHVDILTADDASARLDAYLFPNEVDAEAEIDEEDNEDGFFPLQDYDEFKEALNNEAEAQEAYKQQYMPVSESYSVDPAFLEEAKGQEFGLRERKKGRGTDNDAMLAMALAEIDEEEKRGSRRRPRANGGRK